MRKKKNKTKPSRYCLGGLGFRIFFVAFVSIHNSLEVEDFFYRLRGPYLDPETNCKEPCNVHETMGNLNAAGVGWY